ncbi:MAG: hypothetical protein ACREEM_09565 [Blastocatellia bacterium]
MNPIVISTIIASATFIVAIFSANWLNQRHVDKLMEQMDKRIQEQGRRFDDNTSAVRELTNAQFKAMQEQMNSRFEALEEHMDLRFDNVEQQIRSLDDRVRRLEDMLFKPALR